MNKEDYDKYYQQGGSYVILVELFNELFEDYECFKNDCKKYKEVIDKLKEWINIVQQNKDNKHLEPFISTDELDELLDKLKEVE